MVNREADEKSISTHKTLHTQFSSVRAIIWFKANR